MTNIVKLPFSNTSGNTPVSLVDGQIAINQASGSLFYRNSAGAVTQFPSGSVYVYEFATTANFPATGTAAAIYIATDTSRTYRWSGAAYMELGPIVGSVDTTLRNLLAPPAPTGIAVAASNAQVVVTWSAPTGVLAQSPITDYAVQYSSNSGTSWTTFTRGASTAVSATVTGLTNGTAYVFRVAGVNGVGTGSYSTASSSVTPSLPTDAFFANVAVLLHMDGSDATFIDSSSAPQAITAGGGATQSAAQSKFGGKSAFFAASGDHLTLADSDAIELSNKDFALEFWAQTTNSTQYATLVSRSPGAYGTGAWSLLMNSTSPTSGDIALYASDLGSPILQSTGVNLRDGAWHHIAVSRSGSSLSLYFDGTRVGTGASSASVANIAGGIRIAADQFYGRNFIGYIDDFRLTLNSARGYTGSTITVPLLAFPDSA